MITRFLFLISESFRTLLRAKIPALISSITIGITLIIFSLAYFTYINILGYSFEFKSKYKIEVFFDNNLNLEEARDLFNKILILEGIEQGEFVDKARAAKLFQSFFDKNIEDIVGENPLPMGGRYDIAFDYKSAKKMKNIVQEIKDIDGVDVTSFPYGIISRVDLILENLLGISLVIGVIIFCIAIILVSNTIRLIIHARQDTIETLHLLGATNSFIRLPLIIEGLIQGLFGVGIALAILYFLNSFQSYLLEPIINLKLDIPHNIILYNLIFGILLALIGSLRGISKYLPK